MSRIKLELRSSDESILISFLGTGKKIGIEEDGKISPIELPVRWKSLGGDGNSYKYYIKNFWDSLTDKVTPLSIIKNLEQFARKKDLTDYKINYEVTK